MCVCWCVCVCVCVCFCVCVCCGTLKKLGKTRVCGFKNASVCNIQNVHASDISNKQGKESMGSTSEAHSETPSKRFPNRLFFFWVFADSCTRPLQESRGYDNVLCDRADVAYLDGKGHCSPPSKMGC